MPKTRVVNIRLESYDVRIDRSTKWGNPFSHQSNTYTSAQFRVPTRNAAVASYERWIRDQPELMAALPELRGKILGCWCKPLSCHGDVLLKLLDELDRKESTSGQDQKGDSDDGSGS